MPRGPEAQRTEPFTEELEKLSVDTRDYLNELLELYKRRDSSDRQTVLGSIWAAVKDAKKSIPVEDAIKHLGNSLQVTPAWSAEMKPALEDFKTIKRIVRDSPSTPKDLSRVYRRIREAHVRSADTRRMPLFFGDVIDDCVEAIYDVQNPQTHSLLSQLCYARALSAALFPEVPRESVAVEDFRRSGRPVTVEKLPGRIRRLRMLKDDFDLLSATKIIHDYHSRGYMESGLTMPGEWRVPRSIVGRALSQASSRKTAAYYDVPALGVLNEIRKELTGNQDYVAISNRHIDAYMFSWVAHLRILNEGWALAQRKVIFYRDNAASIDALPPVNWSEIRLAREAPPGAQRVFFERNRGPLLVTVDPAPGNAYVAVVSVRMERDFRKIEEQKGSAEAARDIVSPLRKPFSAEIYRKGSGFSFFVRKNDGELCVYGDSNSAAHAVLGDQYDRCKHLIHHVLQNLMGATYRREDVAPRGPTAPRGESAARESREIPDTPAVRTVPSPSGEASGEDRGSIEQRRAHTRLLPVGWSMSYYAWENARKSGILDIFAVIEEEPGSGRFREEKMILGNDFSAFQKQRDDLRTRYGDLVRFQTYVSQVGGFEDEEERDN